MNTAAIRPWSVQVELVAGCQLRCPFCGINALPWDRDYFQYMEIADVVRVASQIRNLNPNPRIEFALRGEPLKHPRLVQALQLFRKILPDAQLLVVSNGVELLGQKDGQFITSLYRAGLNILLLDCYRPYGERLRKIVKSWNVAARHHNIGGGFWPWINHGAKERHLVFSPDLRDAESRGIMNHAGNAPIGRTPRPLEKTCPNPWREVVIHVDGNMPICCMDFGCEYKLGNVFEQDIRAIWFGEKAVSARKMLRYKKRWFTPCCRCDGPSPGRNKAIALPEAPTGLDMEIVRRANLESPRHNGFEIEWWGPDD